MNDTLNATRDGLVSLIRSESPSLNVTPLAYDQLVFEERVQLACFHCHKYGVSWTCPPRIPSVDYRAVLAEYGTRLLVWCEMPITEDEYETVRRDSTNTLHRALLSAEKHLWDRGIPLTATFIGGSCKLCVGGCDPNRCRQPRLARIPLEATGVNVMKTATAAGFEVMFPPKARLVRVGLIAW